MENKKIEFSITDGSKTYSTSIHKSEIVNPRYAEQIIKHHTYAALLEFNDYRHDTVKRIIDMEMFLIDLSKRVPPHIDNEIHNFLTSYYREKGPS